MTKTELINTLDHLNTVIENYRADSAAISRLLRELSELVNGTIGIRELSFISQAIGRSLTNSELADLILAAQANKPLNEVLQLPAEADAAYTIKYQRRQAGMTQVELARKIGIEQSQLAKIENGSLKVSLNLLQKAMTVFGRSYIVKAL